MFAPNTRLLVVDDMLTMRKIVIKTCKTLGFTDVIEAVDGADAWTKLTESKTPVGLIISDWNMPNSTGLDLLRRVRADQRYNQMPFILVTAKAEQKQVIEALKSGVSGYVVKPFTAELLKAQIVSAHAKLTAKKTA